MRPRSMHLDVAPQGNAYLRLQFSAAVDLDGDADGFGGIADVYLFLNDENGQNEECFLFRISQ
jgi:hypothetical protein